MVYISATKKDLGKAGGSVRLATKYPFRSHAKFMLRTIIGRSLGQVGALLPLKRGLGRVTMSAPAKRLCAGLPRSNVPLRNGLTIDVDPADYNGRMLYLFGTIDNKVVGTCRALLRPGDVFLDIGANHGAVGLLCEGKVLPGGRVECFEPQVQLAHGIEQCCAKHGLKHVGVHAVALADADGSMTLAVQRGHSGTARLSNEDLAGLDMVTVPIRDIRTCVGPLVGERPFGAKVDVEGSEPLVLPYLLGHPGARFILFEAAHMPDARWLWQLIEDGGWSLFALQKALWRIPLVPLTPGSVLTSWDDVVAVRVTGAGNVQTLAHLAHAMANPTHPSNDRL